MKHLNSKSLDWNFSKEEILSKEELREAKERSVKIAASIIGFFLAGGIAYIFYAWTQGRIL